MKSKNQEYQFNSPDLQKNQQDIQKYKRIQNDISIKLQDLSMSLLDFMQKDDPKDRKANIQNRLEKQIKALREQNNKLTQKNRYLSNQIIKLQRKQVQILKNNNDVSSQNQHKSVSQHLQDQIQLSQGSISNRLDLIGCSQQKSSLDQTQKMLKQARQFNKEDIYNIQRLETYLFIFFDKLIRKIDLAEISKSYVGKQDMSDFNKVLVDKDVYKKLLEFYCDTVVIIKKPGQSRILDEINSSKNILEEAIQKNILEKPNNLQFFFENLAKKSGFENEWRQYLRQSKEQSIKFINNIKQIIQDPNDLFKPIKRKGNQSEINIQNNQIEKSRQNNRQQFFFDKITRIINQIGFDSEQKSMWQKLNQKRKLNKMFNTEQLLNKIKQNSKKVSDFFSLYFVITINQMFIHIYRLLDRRQHHYDSNPQQQLDRSIRIILKNNQKRAKQNLSEIIQVRLKELVDDKNDFQSKKNLQDCVIKTIKDYVNVLQNSFFMYHQPVSFTYL